MKKKRITFRVTNKHQGAVGVVCAPVTTPLYFATNVVEPCSRCQAQVQHRPDIPPGLPVICMDCWERTRETDDEMLVTPRSVIEARNWFRRN